MRYNDKINQLYANPQNIGSLDKMDPNVARGKSGGPDCGDQMTLDIKVDPITKKITDAKVKIFGCMSAIASSSYLTELVIGKTIDEAKEITNKDIADYLGLPAVKMHCSVLAEETIKNALDNHLAKQSHTSSVLRRNQSTGNNQNQSSNGLITLTDEALKQISVLLEQADSKACGIKIKAVSSTKSCLEMKYVMDCVDKVEEGDIEIKLPWEGKIVNVIIDGLSLIYLIGTEIDFVTSGLNSRFVFNNPNAAAHCGCGSTFMYTDYFAVMGLEKKYDLLKSELEDKYNEKKDVVPLLILNAAYHTLSSPIRRAEYMLNLAKFDITTEHNDSFPVPGTKEELHEAIIKVFTEGKEYGKIARYISRLKELS